MNSRQKTTVFAATCLVISMSASVLLQHHIDEIRPRATIEDVLYVSSPAIVKRASLGFNGLMACIYWTRAVQYFGNRHHDRSETFNELAPLLEITTTLDPHMIPPYQFGATFLAPKSPSGAGQPDRAIKLMEYGIQHNPDNWQLYYDLGFVYYTELKDYKKASEAFDRGSKVPNAHPLLKLLAAQMEEHAGDFATARMLWTATYEGSHETNIRQNAREHLRCLKVDEDVTNLQAAVDRFTKLNGRPPTSMWEVAMAENLRGIPVDPDGDPYQIGGDGHVLVKNPDDFPFITQGLPPGYKRTNPVKFHSES
ncbi:MAG TPA: tetratricopeptide repeat protein [Candidatus Sulfotelmatobacter sp.]|nr:tetratricopeptide repeat protein [Candidatus Sulfotelmatobacter sp.]